MKMTVRIFDENERRLYHAELDTPDYRRVLNEVRRGRRAVGLPRVTTIQIEGDRQPFRVGGEKDIAAWLQQRTGKHGGAK
jgi:hypothetical protein